MQINRLSPQAGYIWIRQGMWLFKQSPFTFLMLVFLYIFVVQLSMFVPILGLFLVLILNPVIAVGFLTACQKVILKELVKPSIYISPLKDLGPQVRLNLLKLGGIYALLIVLMSLLAAQFIDVEKILPLLSNNQMSAPEMIQEMSTAIIVGACLYMPIAILMWFSPQLVAWQGMSVFKALFGSWMGFWLNKGAFFVYFSTWAVILIAIPLILGALFDAIGMAQYASYLITPLSMWALTVLYCSFFATWKGCFLDSIQNSEPNLQTLNQPIK